MASRFVLTSKIACARNVFFFFVQLYISFIKILSDFIFGMKILRLEKQNHFDWYRI